MAKKLGKKARKFARKNLQSAAKRNRKIRNQFNHRRPRRGGSGAREDGDEDLLQRVDDASTMATNDAADALISGLEFPEDDVEIDADLSDSDGYLSEDPGCPYYSDGEDGDDVKDCIMQDGLDKQNDDMNLDIKKQKKKLKKLLDKDPEFANFLEKWQAELESYRSKEDSDEEDGMDAMDDDDDSNDGNYPNAKILTSKTISEWCQLVSKEPKSPALRNLLNAFRDACQYGVHSDSPSMQRFQNTRVFYQIITFVLSESDNLFRALLEIPDDANKGRIMNLKNSKKWQTVDPLLKSYLRSSLNLLSQLTDNKILAFVLTRLRASAVLFSAYPSTASTLLKNSCERAVTSVGQLNAILRQASKTKEKEDLRKIDNWQYINCVNLWVRFLCCNYKDYNLHPLFSQVLQVLRGVAHLFPGTRYLPLRLKLAQMLNELSTCSQMFFPIPSLLFDCLEFREISQKEQTQKTKVNFLSLLKVPKNMLKSRDFQEECVLSAIQVLSAHFAQWSYHISFPEVATIPLILLKRLHEQTTIESLHRPIKRLIDQVNENKEFIERKREVVSFSPNDKAPVDSFLQEEKSSGNASFTRFYASIAENRQPKGKIVKPMPKKKHHLRPLIS
uniref:Nucleolar complex protein 2 homolog n=1 Tax=Setaria italica TaxID=4555 RepID=K3XVY1_SETIT